MDILIKININKIEHRVTQKNAFNTKPILILN